MTFTPLPSLHSDRSRRSLRPLVDLFFPRTCPLCQERIEDPDRESICTSCLQQLVPDPNRCQRCGAPVPRHLGENPPSCSLCKKDWGFDRAMSLCTYRTSAAKAARLMKSPKHEPLARELGLHLGKWFYATEEWGQYDLIVPIPQHWFRRWKERYNQAEILADAVGETLQIRVEARALYRTKWTEKQGTKTIQERMQSMRGTMAHNSRVPVQDRVVLIVDDILTSGATANDSTRALLNASAKRVDILTFARGAQSRTEFIPLNNAAG